MSEDHLDKYRCKHGMLGHCDYCWSEQFRKKLANPKFKKAREEQRIQERITALEEPTP